MFFDNIGYRLKQWATWAFYVEAIASIIACFAMWIDDIESYFLYGLLVAIGGIASAWFLSALVYGFGELIDRSASIDNKLKRVYPESMMPGAYAEPTYTAPITTHAHAAPGGPAKAAAAGEWVCTRCGKANASYVGTCGCGNSKH